MAHFEKFPAVRVAEHGQYILESAAIYYTDVSGVNNPITVPAGFKTDFASIPHWVPRWVCDPHDESRRPAVIHDWLCRVSDSKKKRVLADKVFREALKLEGVPRWRRAIMYGAVRIATLWIWK